MQHVESVGAKLPTWLITGATGMLGRNVGHWLEGRAHRVGWARTAPSAAAFDSVVSIDLLHEDGLQRALSQSPPDVVLHTAALASHEQCEQDPVTALRMNADAAGAMARAAAAVGARFIHISTDAVFDGATGDYDEDAPTNPFSVYGETKLKGEQLVLEADPDAIVVRSNFFGWSPTGTRSILEFFVNNLRQGTPVRGYDDFVVTSIYAAHLAEALWELNSIKAAGILHVASSDALSKYDFGRAVARAFDLDATLIQRSSASIGNHATSRARNLSLDTSRAAVLLKRPLPTQAEGIRTAAGDELTAKIILSS